MKTKIFLTALLMCVVWFTACDYNTDVAGNKNNHNEILYKECENNEGYLDTVLLEGIGYLFADSIPVNLQKEQSVMYFIYCAEVDSATSSGPTLSNGYYRGNVCNFPDFAKEWKIPYEGKQIYYKGEFKVSGEYLSIPTLRGGNLILTTFYEVPK